MKIIFLETESKGIEYAKVLRGYLYRVGREIFTTLNEAKMYLDYEGEKIE